MSNQYLKYKTIIDAVRYTNEPVSVQELSRLVHLSVKQTTRLLNEIVEYELDLDIIKNGRSVAMKSNRKD